ncbi:MAG: 3-oxoacyl-[acyl-carrier-protein] reductase [Phycisphaerae bacterium]
MQDRVALVTGGSRGIGRAICLALASRGAKVVACARNYESLLEVASEARRRELPGEIDPRVLDVADRAAVEPFVDALLDSHKRIDILVNNAGITRDGLMMSMDDDQFDDVLTTNLRSVFWLTRAVSRTMVRQRYGRIVNIGSVSGIMGNAGQVNYSASKAGLIGFTKALAKELGKRKITCNVLAPGFITTDMTATLPDTLKESVKQIVPLGRFGEVEEVAEVAAFLASDVASYITGQVLSVDGGLHT